MKNTTFLVILAVYGILTGCLTLFNANNALMNYGLTSIDQNHVAIFQYLGISGIGLGVLAYLTSKANSNNAIRNFLLATGLISIGSFLKSCYDIFIVGFPANNYSWIDSAIRLIVGLACFYFFMKTKKD